MKHLRSLFFHILFETQIKVCDMPKHMADAVVAAAITFLSQDVQQKDVATHLKV